jgi:hypothetical protein
MTRRDVDYIGDRLLAPGADVTEAIERMRRVGMAAEAAELFDALEDLRVVCRRIRKTVAAAPVGSSGR